LQDSPQESRLPQNRNGIPVPQGLKEDIKDTVKSMGLVFGDIGTSPIYTLSVIFLTMPNPTPDEVLGILSLIVWTLIILVTMEYAWLAMKLSERGEGGTIVLREILVPLLKSGRKLAFVTVLTFIGISLFIGDGVITPAISILSAVEGIRFVPSLEATETSVIVLIAVIIAILLFLFQRRGTERVSKAFGPIMLIWFGALAVSGVIAISQFPVVVTAINPLYALSFLYSKGLVGFFVLSEVILCATGGEALYADIGHLGRKPIVRAWYFVFFVLILNYLGQGAFQLGNPGTGKNLLFGMVDAQSALLYLPFLIVAISATIIASQAMISGVYSVVYQAIHTRLLPWIRVEYTSERRRSQIYIGSANWMLLIAVLAVMLVFQQSSNLAAAYGLAVTGTMSITGILMTMIFYIKKKRLYTAAAAFVTFVDVAFLVSNGYKIPHGGYFSLLIAGFLLIIAYVYIFGHKRLETSLRRVPLKDFLYEYNTHYDSISRIKGTAVFLSRDQDMLPPYIPHTMFTNHILYDDNILLTLRVLDEPYGIDAVFKRALANGLEVFEIQVGYLETILDFEEILKSAGINEIAIFYGIEDIVSTKPLSRAYAILDNLTPTFVQFYRLPPDKLHGVVVRVEM
jgi:KUP system potassium uptake protein